MKAIVLGLSMSLFLTLGAQAQLKNKAIRNLQRRALG